MNVGVLASGEGTNLQALIDRVHGREAHIVAVGSDRPQARALERARRAGIRTAAFPLAERTGRAARYAPMAAQDRAERPAHDAPMAAPHRAERPAHDAPMAAPHRAERAAPMAAPQRAERAAPMAAPQRAERAAPMAAANAADRAAMAATDPADRAARAAPVAATDPTDRAARDAAMAEWLADAGVELVVLAGYMRLLAPIFLSRFPQRVINVHPALLPAFPGVRAIEEALAYGVKVFGVTVHFVDEGVDTGPIILQRAVELPAADDPADVRAALAPIEHELLSEAVRLIARGAVRVDGRRVLIAPA